MQQPTQPAHTDGRPGLDLNRMVNDPAFIESVAYAVHQLADLTHVRAKEQGKAAVWATAVGGIVAVLVVAAVVGPVTWLTATGKIPPDAATFVFGAIIGAGFTYLRDFFPHGSQ